MYPLINVGQKRSSSIMPIPSHLDQWSVVPVGTELI
jgi:hypothetical protein